MIAIIAKLREFAPYAAILMLAGGSVMAVLLWFHRRPKSTSSAESLVGRSAYAWGAGWLAYSFFGPR